MVEKAAKGLPAPQGEGLGVGSVTQISAFISENHNFLDTDPTPYPSPTMGGEFKSL